MKKVKDFKDCTIVAIRIRGTPGVMIDIKNTLARLKLTNKHHCVLLKDTPDINGMLKKCKDYITWGIIGEVKKELIDKRGKKDSDGNYAPIFTLHPPRGGFERKGIKKPFSVGGVLGNRKDKIDDLLKRML